MKTKQGKIVKVTGRNQLAALASPLRLEILGLFTSPEPLAIADMAPLMGRAPGSLYHHVGILEEAGLLYRAGTRPKGKRHEALFLPSAPRIEVDARSGGAEVAAQAVKTMASAFRMAERDLESALQHDTCLTEGPGRNLFAARVHLRARPKVLGRINKHLKAIEDLLSSEAGQDLAPSPEDQHLSLTIALLPLKGRGNAELQKGG